MNKAITFFLLCVMSFAAGAADDYKMAAVIAAAAKLKGTYYDPENAAQILYTSYLVPVDVLVIVVGYADNKVNCESLAHRLNVGISDPRLQHKCMEAK